MPGRGNIDAIYCSRCWKKQKKLPTVFVDLENMFGCVPRKVTWWILKTKGVMERQVFAITEMYKNMKTSVTIDIKSSKKFEVKAGDDQGSVFNPFLFEIVMDEITN